jgi:hypothetical protein
MHQRIALTLAPADVIRVKADPFDCLSRFTRNIEGKVQESMTKITVPINLIADYKERYKLYILVE